ncbi:MAG: hypothetical protein RL557_317 [archaeon]|jgi:hypothetical protein
MKGQNNKRSKIRIVIIFLVELIIGSILWGLITNHPSEIIKDESGKIFDKILICIETDNRNQWVTVFYLNLSNYKYECSKKDQYYDLKVLSEGDQLIIGKHYIIKNIKMNEIEIETPSIWNRLSNN